MKVEQNGLEVAVIGLAGRFPGSKNIDKFWQNLVQGREFTSVLVKETTKESVKAAALLEDIDLFDASFFGINPREAEIMDPQHRLFLECAWEALENAGYAPTKEDRLIGVYAGVGASTYLLYNLFPNNLNQTMGYFPTLLASDKDYAPTRVSYKLNLTGPSVSVGTACSSSLVAVNLAYQSLLSGQCDMALAAGVSIKAPQNAATLCPEGISTDGHCRAFDARANGTIGGNGVGVVVLKRLTEAIADRDYIYAVLKGSSVNNDGAVKVSYTAPSEQAQAQVIRAAQIMAEVEPETISYVETHGTGTALGDPIEIAALKQAFSTDKKGYCAIGSVKTNIGHLDAAAGIASLIKTVLALDRKLLPPSINFETPSPQIDFANSPFFVNTKLSEWQANGTPRRAGVSSFGFGGTNAHLILEEAPLKQLSVGANGHSPVHQLSGRKHHLMVVSAKTSSALETATANLVNHLKQYPDLNLADVAYTLQVGRQSFPHKQAVICQNVEDAIEALQEPKRVLTNFQETSKRSLAFMFTGLGTHYVDMARELYQVEPIFRQQIDRCCQFLEPLLDLDLREIIYPSKEELTEASTPPKKINLRQMLGRDRQPVDQATAKLNQTHLTQPAIFVIEYALAQLWQSWGIRPSAMIGYSIGEYVAATIAGVFSLEDALTLVAKRAKMIAKLPSGAMLAVPLSEEEVRPLLNRKLSLSAVNGATQCVIAGFPEAVDELEEQLIKQGLACRRLQTSHAFHSQMMEAIAPSFRKLLDNCQLQPPQIPYLSNLTGTWITAAQATDPNYWVKHLCQPVRFAAQVRELWQKQQPIFLEIGAGQTLSSLALQCLEQVPAAEKIALPSLRHAYEGQSDTAFLFNTLAQLWLSGVEIDWAAFSAYENHYRVPLPTYPFEGQRYWLAPPAENKPLELWQSLVTTAQSQAREGVKKLDAQAHQEQRQCLDRLCIAYMNQTLRRLGAFSDGDRYYCLEELFEQCRVLHRYRELLERWLNVLVQQSHLQQDREGNFGHLQPLATDLVSNLLSEVKAKSADILALEWIDIYHNYSINLPAILTGEREPLEFHFSMKLQEEGYTVPEYPSMAYYEPILRSLIEQIVKSLPTNSQLRILELGAGTGSATEKILPLLPSEQTHYTFTDIGSFFLNIAKQKFSDCSFIEYEVLDIEKSPQAQGYSTHSFDLVIAFNVLHVAQNIETTVDYVRSLLAPGGLLLLWEITEARFEADIMDGVLMQPIADETGKRNMGDPYLSKQQWQEILTAHGFAKVEAFSEFPAFREHIFVAEADTGAISSVPPAFTAPKDGETIEPSQINRVQKKPDIADWFYIPSWKRSPLPSRSPKTDSGCWLIFIDELGLGAQITKQLQLERNKVVLVKAGAEFSRETSQSDRCIYTINPHQQNDYQRLVKDLLNLNLLPEKIIHCWTLNNESDRSTVDDLGFYSLLFLSQALGAQNLKDKIEINLISHNLHEVMGTETLEPIKALVLGPCKVIPTEYPQFPCRNIDLVLPSGASQQLTKLADRLITELDHPITEETIVYRGEHRWLQTFEPVKLTKSKQAPEGLCAEPSSQCALLAAERRQPSDALPCKPHSSYGGVTWTTQPESPPLLRPNGVYLITGGLGNLGLVVAKYLARTVRAKLVLCGRSDFPQPEQWQAWLSSHNADNRISNKIRQLIEIEQLGAEIMIVRADVSHLESMQALRERVKKQWGDIRGVIHSAGIPVPGKIQTRTPEVIKSVLAAKVEGVFVLEQIFQATSLDFLILFSSLSSVSGGYAVDYVAASHFLDAYANFSATNRPNRPLTIALDWDTWQMAHQTEIPEELQLFYQQNQKTNIAAEEGTDAFDRILRNQFSQVLISPKDLNFAIQQHRSAQQLENGTKANPSQKSYPRPNLRNAYVIATNDTERAITKLWQKFLGIEPIGIHDNFFALGGDSLTGSILINQLRDDFQIELPVRSLFESPTVAELALLIENLLIEELEALDEEEANLILQKEQTTAT